MTSMIIFRVTDETGDVTDLKTADDVILWSLGRGSIEIEALTEEDEG